MLKKNSRKTLFTTPSHDGNICVMHKFYQWYRNDISEVDAFEPVEELREAEKNASKIYGTKSTHFLTNGSTSGIIASVLTCCCTGDKLLIWSKSHPCHKNAGILSGAEIIEYELPYNSEWGIYQPLEPKEYEKLIKKYSPKALIITSPSYEGMVSDVREIASLCKKFGVYLVVDEAHGALYPFSEDLPQSAVRYADFTVQSLHKTAGGLNPTALLHNNTDLDVSKALGLINSTSPSYPLLATIEANINFLNSKRGRKQIAELISNIKNLRGKLVNLDFYGDDITKILIKKDGLTGYQLSELLYEKYNIEDERTNEVSTMLLTGIGTTKEKLKRLEKLRKIQTIL